LRTTGEFQPVYRQLQVVTGLYNEGMSYMIAVHQVPAFIGHLGANYGMIKLFNKIDLKTWINFPIVAIGGSIVLHSAQKNWACLRSTSEDTIKSWKNIPNNQIDSDDQCSFENFLKSCPVLSVKAWVFYAIRKSTLTAFFYAQVEYTVSLLVAF
jgi:hypothetical protein